VKKADYERAADFRDRANSVKAQLDAEIDRLAAHIRSMGGPRAAIVIRGRCRFASVCRLAAACHE